MHTYTRARVQVEAILQRIGFNVESSSAQQLINVVDMYGEQGMNREDFKAAMRKMHENALDDDDDVPDLSSFDQEQLLRCDTMCMCVCVCVCVTMSVCVCLCGSVCICICEYMYIWVYLCITHRP